MLYISWILTQLFFWKKTVYRLCQSEKTNFHFLTKKIGKCFQPSENKILQGLFFSFNEKRRRKNIYFIFPIGLESWKEEEFFSLSDGSQFVKYTWRKKKNIWTFFATKRVSGNFRNKFFFRFRCFFCKAYFKYQKAQKIVNDNLVGGYQDSLLLV